MGMTFKTIFLQLVLFVIELVVLLVVGLLAIGWLVEEVKKLDENEAKFRKKRMEKGK